MLDDIVMIHTVHRERSSLDGGPRPSLDEGSAAYSFGHSLSRSLSRLSSDSTASGALPATSAFVGPASAPATMAPIHLRMQALNRPAGGGGKAAAPPKAGPAFLRTLSKGLDQFR